MKRRKKIVMSVIILILLCILGYVAYYLIHYHFYNEYRKYLTSYEVEEGTEFKAIKETKADVAGMVLVAENDSIKLYTNTETAEVAFYDKRNKETVYSNPVNANEDPIATGTNLDFLKSQLIVEYFNEKRAAGIYDSYSMSVARGQVSAQAIENGIRYTYFMGDQTSETGIVPVYIKTSKLDEVIKILEDAGDSTGARYISGRYLESSIGSDYMELNEKSKKGASTLRKLNSYFEAAGFTEEDFTKQMLDSGVEGAVSISFEVSIEYRLNKDGVDVSVPMSSVKENGGGKIYRIQLLRYLGAGSDKEDGYMVVPNGSGSMIEFNNGKTNVENYTQYVYGIDYMNADYTVTENTQAARLGLFGICRENSSVLATIEDGDTLCYITAGVAGNVNSYNYTYPSFVLRGYDKLSMFGTTGNEADIPIVEEDFYNVNLSVKYSMLTEENKGYSGIANYYRERLIEEGILTAKEETNDIPFYYDVLGGVKETSSILGVQYLSVNPVTTFEQAGVISDDLLENGISNQVMNYQGWFNGGYYHDVPDKIKVTNKLGGESRLEDLSAKLTENGGRFYADVVFQKATFISKRYEYSLETSRYYGAGYVAYFGAVNPGTLRQTSSLGYEEIMFNLVSPKFLVRYIDKFTDKIQKYDISGISLRDLGDELHSDKKRTNVINREDALDVVLGQFDLLDSTEKNLMVSDGNEYAFAYADDIINAPLADNDFFIIDEEIPLYEMIIHGSIDYSGKLINLSDTFDKSETILKLIETGASPHFVFSYDGSSDLKYTGLLKYYATSYDNWKSDAVYIYNEVNSALKSVTGAKMTEHIINPDGTKKITYSNGVIIYINNTDKDITVDGIKIAANSYGLGGE